MREALKRQKIILDVDTGVDDALAILYALLSENLDVVGITTCFGNVDVELATANTLSLVELSGMDCPVHKGASGPMVGTWGGPVPWIHGENGLGNAPFPKATRKPESEDAASFIRRTILAHPGEVTLVPVARMTNVARAFLYDPTLASQVKRVVMMGGAAFCPGNVTPVAEANIWGDPHAAHLVFQSGAPITMVGLDVTMKTRLTASHLRNMDQRRAYTNLLRQALEFYMKAYETSEGADGLWCPLHDPLAVGVAEDPDLCDARPFYVDVETSGRLTSGMTVVDARAGSTEPPNASVCIAVDEGKFLTRFCQALGIDH